MGTTIRKTLPSRGVKAFVESIPLPATGRDSWYDPAVLGLYLRVTPKGVKTWTWGYRNPTPRKLVIGKWPRVDQDAARRLAQIAQRELDLAGTDPTDAKKARRKAAETAMTARRAHRRHTAPEGTLRTIFGLYIQDFQREVAKGAKSQVTLDELRRIIGKEMADLMDLPMAEITDDMIWRIMDGIRARGAMVSANRFLAWAKSLWGWAIAHRRLVDAAGQTIKTNPLAGLRKLEKEKPRERFLHRDEVILFWRATETLEPVWRGFFRLLLLTGQRLSELQLAEWKEFDGHVWRVPGHRVGRKNHGAHAVYLSDAAMEVLADLPRTSGPYVFSLDGERPIASVDDAKERLDTAMLAAAGLPGKKYTNPFVSDPRDLTAYGSFTSHDLRRTAATHMGELRIAPHVIELALGHKLPGVMGTYNRAALEEECAKALTTWANQIIAWTSGEPSNVLRPVFG
jgi:integrase